MLNVTDGVPKIDANQESCKSTHIAMKKTFCQQLHHKLANFLQDNTVPAGQWHGSSSWTVPFLWPQLAGVFGTVMHDDHSERRVPSSQLPQPLPHDSRRTDNDAGLEQATAVQACQEGCQLDGFPQAHLIPNDASCSLCVQLPQPLHTWRESNNPYGSA